MEPTMDVSHAEQRALREAQSISGELAKTVRAFDALAERIINLAQSNGSRIERLEHEVARISGPDFYQATAQSLIADPKFAQLVAHAYEQMLLHTKKYIEGMTGKQFLNNREASKILGITAHALSNMRKRKEGPRWSGSGKWVRYQRSDVERWLRELPTTET
jgi:predicted DNA-binding transcriptional regulator AlpA